MPDLPIIELVLPLVLDQTAGMTAISLVDKPAIGVGFLMFSDEGKPKAEPLKFAYDAEKGIVTGPILIPNQQIRRKPTKLFPQGFQCWMSVETIQQAVQLFFAQGKTIDLNIMHDPTQRCSGFIWESWIKEYTDNDKSNVHFPGLPVGTAFISVQLKDEATKQLVRDGHLAGFSMEGFFDLVETSPAQPATTPIRQSAMSNKVIDKKKSTEKGLFAKLKALFASDADDIEKGGPVTVKADDGTETTLTLDAKGEVKCTMADGTEAVLQLSLPEADDAAPAPGDTAAVVTNPMDVTALRAQHRAEFAKEQADTEKDELLQTMAQALIELKEEIAELAGAPAGPPAKGEAAQKGMKQAFGKTVAPKELTAQEQADANAAARREKRFAPKA